MRRAYLLAYDIMDPKRLRHFHKLAKAFGYPIQYSLFSCTLNCAARVELAAKIEMLIDAKRDRVVIIDIGPVADAGSWIPALEVFGNQKVPTVRTATII